VTRFPRGLLREKNRNPVSVCLFVLGAAARPGIMHGNSRHTNWRRSQHADINSLASRSNAEVSAVEEKVQKFQAEKAEEYKQRQKRLDQLGNAFDQLREVRKPRLELLVQKFDDRVQAAPLIVHSTREASFHLQSRLARARLKFSASTDWDVRKVNLGYDLEIIPVLMRVKSHDEVEFPRDAVDQEAVPKWFEDRMVDFVRTYFSLGESSRRGPGRPSVRLGGRQVGGFTHRRWPSHR
jgi:hypothetical protein